MNTLRGKILHYFDLLFPLGRRIRFYRDFIKYRRIASSGKTRFSIRWTDRYPRLGDDTGTTPFDRHYVYHTSWAARMLASIRPECHIDISSSLYFCGIISAFFPVRHFDFRPPEIMLDNLTVATADICGLKFDDGSLSSVSCMHVVEHIGLGRYGDPLDPDADLRAMAELKRVLAPGGSLLFVVPIGRPRIMFNAHRIYSYEQITDYFTDLELKDFALIPDSSKNGGLIRDAKKVQANEQRYGCGCFWFKKALNHEVA
jgi:SAM-dependent methyltransferase